MSVTDLLGGERVPVSYLWQRGAIEVTTRQYDNEAISESFGPTGMSYGEDYNPGLVDALTVDDVYGDERLQQKAEHFFENSGLELGVDLDDHEVIVEIGDRKQLGGIIIESKISQAPDGNPHLVLHPYRESDQLIFRWLQDLSLDERVTFSKELAQEMEHNRGGFEQGYKEKPRIEFGAGRRPDTPMYRFRTAIPDDSLDSYMYFEKYHVVVHRDREGWKEEDKNTESAVT